MMNKVFVVETDFGYEGNRLEAICSSMTSAIEFCQKYKEAGHSLGDGIFIKPYTVDVGTDSSEWRQWYDGMAVEDF